MLILCAILTSRCIGPTPPLKKKYNKCILKDIILAYVLLLLLLLLTRYDLHDNFGTPESTPNYLAHDVAILDLIVVSLPHCRMFLYCIALFV